MWAGDGFPVELLSYDDTRHPRRSAARSLHHLAHVRSFFWTPTIWTELDVSIHLQGRIQLTC